MASHSSFINPIHLASASENASGAPDWIQIFPKGPELKTGDGRSFKLSDVNALATTLNEGGRHVLIDYDHRSFYAPDEGGSSQAAGWLTKFEVREGALFALAEWTKKATGQIVEKLYRFISPEFTIDEKTNEVIALNAVSLVNRPAFEMVALASTQKYKELEMEKIALALGLPKDADEATILAALEKRDSEHKTELATAQKSATTPSVDDFMPRADYDTVLARAVTAEKTITETTEKDFTAKVETMIATAVKAGKITPASKDHYVALCVDETSFENTRKALEISPEVIGKTKIEGQPEDDEPDDAERIAHLARTYQKTQRDAGVEVTTVQAVEAVSKGMK